MMHPEINYYGLLGIPSTATADEITAAYRKTILKVHLDKLSPGEDADLCYKVIEANRVLSNPRLRVKYDIERDPSFRKSETFIPAGYICYDIGENLPSRRMLQSLQDWKSEFTADGGLHDNYFESFAHLLGEVIDRDRGHIHSANPTTPALFECAICDRSFVSKTHHWDAVLCPYVELFSTAQHGLGVIGAYFESKIEYFTWTPRYLPRKLLGFWAAAATVAAHELWLTCDQAVREVLGKIPPNLEFVDDQIDFMEKLISMAKNGESIFGEIIRWVLEHQDEEAAVVDRMYDLLLEDDLQDIAVMASVMKNLLECSAGEWTALAEAGLDSQRPELAMLWIKIGVEFQDIDPSHWFDLGIRIRSTDPLLSHFCFLAAGYTSAVEWRDVANAFAKQEDHFAAAEYVLYGKTEPEELLSLAKDHPKNANLYTSLYQATKVRGVLENLQNNPAHAQEQRRKLIQQLIQLVIEVSDPDPMPGFKLIASTWTEEFDEPTFIDLHRSMVTRRSKILSIRQFQTILEAYHYLPQEEADIALPWLAIESSKLYTGQLQSSMTSCDFKGMTDALLQLTTRWISGAQSCVDELDLDLTSSPHLRAMAALIRGTIHKVNRNWLPAVEEYTSALLSTPECMARLIPAISRLCAADLEFHEAVVSAMESEVTDLKSALTGTDESKVEACLTRSGSFLLMPVAPQVNYGYKDMMARIQKHEIDQNQVPQPPPDPSEVPVETNTPLITLDKNEAAIETNDEHVQSHLARGLSYIDLLKALPVNMRAGPIVMAASHFVQAMDEEVKDPGTVYALRNAIHELAADLLRIDGEAQAVIQHCLTHKHMLSILISANRKLSKVMGTGPGRSVLTETSSTGSHESQADALESVEEEESEESKEESSEDDKRSSINGKAQNGQIAKESSTISQIGSQGSLTPEYLQNGRAKEKNLVDSGKWQCETGIPVVSEKCQPNGLAKQKRSLAPENQNSEIRESEIITSINTLNGNTIEINPLSTKQVGKIGRIISTTSISAQNNNTGKQTPVTSTENITNGSSVVTTSDSSSEEDSDTTDESSEEEEPPVSVPVHLHQSQSLGNLPTVKIADIIDLEDTSSNSDDLSSLGAFPPRPTKPLLSQSDSSLLSTFLRKVVHSPSLQPLVAIPPLHCSDLAYVETVANSFLISFCAEKIRSNVQSSKIPAHIHAYTQLIEVWKGRSELSDFHSARLRAMEELLAIYGMTLASLEKSLIDVRSLTSHKYTYGGIHGFRVDLRTGQLYFALSTEFKGPNVFNIADLIEVMTSILTTEDESENYVRIDLESPDPSCMALHPLLRVSAECDLTHRPLYSRLLARVAETVISLASGFEVSHKSPFTVQRSEVTLARIPEHLAHFLRPISARSRGDIPRRRQTRIGFVLQVDTVMEEEIVNPMTLTCRIGQVCPRLEVEDSDENSQTFAWDFTRHYDEVGTYYPEFLRLKEFVKMTVIGMKLKKLARTSKTGKIRSAVDSFTKSVASMSAGKGLTVPAWIPAPFCNNLDDVMVAVCTGIEIKPEITYGPVGLPRNSRWINVNEIFAIKGKYNVNIQKSHSFR